MRLHQHLRGVAQLVLIAALLGQPIVGHLHALVDGDFAAGHQRGVAAAESSLRDGTATVGFHEGAECPLCLARAQSKQQSLAPTVGLSAPVVSSSAPPSTRVAPLARPTLGTPSLRGPPALV